MLKSKIANKLIILGLIAAMCCAAFASAFAVTQEEKDAAEKAAKQRAAEAEAKKKEATETAKKAAAVVKSFEDAEKKLDNLQTEIEGTEALIGETKTAIGNKEAEIVAKQAEIDTKEAEIKTKEKEIKDKEDEIKEQNDALNNRLTAMYKTGNAGFVDVVLSSDSVRDLINNVNMVHKIYESDQELLDSLKEDHKLLKEMKLALEETKVSLEGDKVVLEEHKAALEVEKVVLEDQQIALEAKEVETEELKKRYKEEADKLHALLEQKEAEAAQMAAEAAQMQAEAEAMIVELEKAEGENALPANTGAYAWPTNANWIETDKYGWRICPFHGREFHNGLDLALENGTMGSPVYAIANGVVTKASWYGGYGNCIMYAIKGGYTVLYGHLSGFNCSSGDVVKKGQLIGYIGSTGASTGPHLHFTVFKGGSTIDPYSLY